MRLLLVGRRLAAPLKESIRQNAQIEKMDEPDYAIDMKRPSRGPVVCGVELRPSHGNMSPATIGQFHEQQRLATARKPGEHRQHLPLKGMACARDPYRCRKILVMGSLTAVPSTG